MGASVNRQTKSIPTIHVARCTQIAILARPVDTRDRARRKRAGNVVVILADRDRIISCIPIARGIAHTKSRTSVATILIGGIEVICSPVGVRGKSQSRIDGALIGGIEAIRSPVGARGSIQCRIDRTIVMWVLSLLLSDITTDATFGVETWINVWVRLGLPDSPWVQGENPW